MVFFRVRFARFNCWGCVEWFFVCWCFFWFVLWLLGCFCVGFWCCVLWFWVTRRRRRRVRICWRLINSFALFLVYFFVEFYFCYIYWWCIWCNLWVCVNNLLLNYCCCFLLNINCNSDTSSWGFRRRLDYSIYFFGLLCVGIFLF